MLIKKIHLPRIIRAHLHIWHQKRCLHVYGAMKTEYICKAPDDYAEEGRLFGNVIVVKEAAYWSGLLVE